MTTGRLLGGLLAFCGFWLAIYPLAFASMIDPETPDEAWWGDYWSSLVCGGGLPIVLMGMVLMVLGSCLIIGGPRGRADLSERI